MESSLPTWVLGVITVLGVAVIALAAWIRQLNQRLNATLGSTDSQKLEETLVDYFQHVRSTDKKLDTLTTAYSQLAAMTGLAAQKISVVRFNPFGDTGGDQSFVLAVLDSHNSGYVLTSIHGREGTRVYVKPIDYGKSKYTLSAEEQQAFNQASKRVPRTRVKREESSGTSKQI